MLSHKERTLAIRELRRMQAELLGFIQTFFSKWRAAVNQNSISSETGKEMFAEWGRLMFLKENIDARAKALGLIE